MDDIPFGVLEHFFGESSFASLLASSGFGAAVFHRYTMTILVLEMPVVLHVAQDELHIGVVVSAEAQSVFLHARLDWRVLFRRGPMGGICMDGARSYAQVHVLWRSNITGVELLLESVQRRLVAVMIDVIFRLDMLYEICDSGHHLLSWQSVDVVFNQRGDGIQIVVLVHVVEGGKSMSMRCTIPLIFCGDGQS